MILLTEDQLNGLFNQLRGSCLKAYEQENERSSSDFVMAAILDTPNPPLPVSEDREVWVEVSVDDELPDYYKTVPVVINNGIFRAWLASDGDKLMWTLTELDTIVDPTRWLKKVKLSSLVLNQSK